MATAEAETSRDERSPPGGSVYDGFISYSHAADDLLAPRLQAGLQRFAKPWWKRRALRIFRDESSLSANPHLWSSITDALDQSGWFVLLLSPDAAQSEWVNQEIEYWLEHKDPERIIPVLTDGTFGWSDGDVTGDAVPPALHGVFSDEPRWVDLRFARDEDQLDLQDPRFADAVADIASAIRGVPKDELASEEVRQHRRTVRTAWAAGFALSALVIVASGAALYAVNQQNRANDEATRANQLADQEAAARQEAETQRQLAEDNAATAQEQAAIAKSRELAASAVGVLDDNPELSMLLGLESVHAAPAGSDASPAGVLVLREAVQANQLVRRFPVAGRGDNFSRMSRDGATVYVWDPPDGTVRAIDTATGEELWAHQEPTATTLGPLGLSPDGELLALTVDAGTVDSAEGPARVVVLRAGSGEPVAVLNPGLCPAPVIVGAGFSADGGLLMVGTGSEGCGGIQLERWVSVYDTATWEEVHRLTTTEGIDFASLSAASDRVLLNAGNGPVELRSLPGLELIAELGRGGASALSPDGTHAVITGASDEGRPDLRPFVVDAETGQRLFFLDAVDDFLFGDTIIYSPDGSKIVVTTRSTDHVFDATDGRLLATLGERGPTFTASWSDDGTRLLTSMPGSVLLWDLGGQGSEVGVPITLDLADAVWINGGNEVAVGPNLALRVLADRDGKLTFVTAVFDPETSAVTGEIEGQGVQLPDGRFAVKRLMVEGDDLRLGPIVLWDPESGTTTELTTCSVLESTADGVNPVDCPGGEALFASPGIEPGVAVASDGSFIAAESYTVGAEPRLVRVWDAGSHEVITEFEVSASEFLYSAGPSWTAASDFANDTVVVRAIPSGEEIVRFDEVPMSNVHEVSSDAALLYIADWFGDMWVYDTATWEAVARWNTHDAQLRGFALSPDGNRLATAAVDDLVKVWDVSGIRAGTPATDLPPLLDRIPAPTPSDVAWLTDDRLVAFLADDARWLELSLAVDDLVSDTTLRLTRSFTESECATYQIDPCPTLDEIRNR